MISKYFEDIGTTDIDFGALAQQHPEVAVKLWGAGGGGSNGGAGGFVRGIINTTRAGVLTIEVGSPVMFIGPLQPKQDCQGTVDDHGVMISL